MDYFFDASAGVNFGGDFDFAPHQSGGGSSLLSSSSSPSMALPDFTAPSSHLDHHHHHHAHHNPHQTHSSHFSFYGSSDATAGVYSSPLDEFHQSAATSSIVPSSSTMTTSASSSSSSSSTPSAESPVAADADSRRFHDSAASAAVVVDRRRDDLGANPEDSNEASSSSSSSTTTFSSLGKASTSTPSPLTANIIDNSNSDSGLASSSSPGNHDVEAGASSSSSNQLGASAEVGSKKDDEATPEDDEEEPEADEEPTIDININNVVCSFSVRCHLNLRKVAMEACNTEYNRNRACVKMKLRKPKITASIWNSGKITCIGATSEADSKIGARRVARILMRMGFNVHFCRFRVVNVLASCTMPFAIRLHTFSAKYPKLVEYEPELHPAATYRIKHPKATLKIFSTGSITITAPHVSHISQSVEHIYPRVQEFRMDEKDKESGEMANLVPKAFVPLNTKLGRIKHIPKGPFHSKFKQVIHQQDLVKKAIQQVKDNESSDEDAMYMGCDDDEEDVEFDNF